LPHFEVTAFLAAAIGLLGLISLCLLVFGRLGVGSIVAFLVAGIVIGQARDIPAQTILVPLHRGFDRLAEGRPETSCPLSGVCAIRLRPKADISFVAGYLAVLKTFI
jgi:Kef-type K+ transport system membrane component KefB